jgi:hypothetical protein
MRASESTWHFFERRLKEWIMKKARPLKAKQKNDQKRRMREGANYPRVCRAPEDRSGPRFCETASAMEKIGYSCLGDV